MIEMEILQAAFRATLANVEGLAPTDLDRPTPCADWDVRALLSHVVAANDGLVATLHDQPPDWERDALGDDPAAAVRRSLAEALDAWQQPGAVDKPSTQMPGMRVVDFAVGDAVAHGWDLAAALGRPFEIDDRLLVAAHERWAGEPSEIGRQFGVFGPRVDVPPDASVLDRLLGDVGRDPSWRPPD